MDETASAMDHVDHILRVAVERSANPENFIRLEGRHIDAHFQKGMKKAGWVITASATRRLPNVAERGAADKPL